MLPGSAGILRSPGRLIAVVTTVAAVALYFAPIPDGMTPMALQGAAVCLFAIGLFATGAMPEYLAALMFMTVAMILGVASAPVVFAGFYSTAFWLLFAGVILGVAVHKTGISARLVSVVAERFATSYLSLVVGMVTVGIVLSFLMPSSMSRMIIIVPMVAALCDEIGFEPGTNERTGLILTAVAGAWMPATAILPANVPNMVLAGVAEREFGITFTYGHYLLTQFPVNGLVKTVLMVGVTFLLFPPRKGSRVKPVERRASVPLNADGRRLAVILTLTIGLWATDFLHHISPAWVGMAAAIACMIPGFGSLTGDDFKTKVNIPSTIYVAGILGLGAVLVDTGAGAYVGDWLLKHMPLSPDAPFTSFMALIGLEIAVNMASTAPSVPVIVGPLAQQISEMTGFPVMLVLMTQVIGYSSILLPYQAPPLIVGLHLGGVALKDGIKITVAVTLLSLIVLSPLNYLWWGFLGLFG